MGVPHPCSVAYFSLGWYSPMTGLPPDWELGLACCIFIHIILCWWNSVDRGLVYLYSVNRFPYKYQELYWMYGFLYHFLIMHWLQTSEKQRGKRFLKTKILFFFFFFPLVFVFKPCEPQPLCIHRKVCRGQVRCAVFVPRDLPESIHSEKYQWLSQSQFYFLTETLVSV